ncbi:hypothetical protein KIM372_16790 [Bombiscardovia nodaiensis]|uniref:HTH cro/C1-type domain-containing protein n=1 Tax=Bombiscardovia nodaiensis TaxID=2932181 RepID=A0ABN6SCE6_9BIFI|nr:hypothetical protein KIM372_16790 [Bombiscardovia nodaiensis]
MKQRIRTMMDVGMAFKAGRQAKGWTQEELARRAHVSRSWLAQVETGKPSFDTYKVLATLQALDLTLWAVSK